MSAFIIIICFPGKSIFYILLLYFFIFAIFCFHTKTFPITKQCADWCIGLWNRRSFFTCCSVSVCWAGLQSALLIRTWKQTWIKENSCCIVTFDYAEIIVFTSPYKGSSGLAMFLKWLACHPCNLGHAGTVKVQKCNWKKKNSSERDKNSEKDFT